MDPAIDLVLRGTLALLFGAAAVHKARDLTAFRAILADYRLLPGPAVPLVADLLVVLEAALAVALPLTILRGPAALAALLLLAVYTGAIAVNLARGRRDIDCGCGGPALSQPLGPWLLARNGLLLLAALAAATPPGSRALTALDAITVPAGVAAFALLYVAAGRLMASWPAHARLRRAS